MGKPGQRAAGALRDLAVVSLCIALAVSCTRQRPPVAKPSPPAAALEAGGGKATGGPPPASPARPAGPPSASPAPPPRPQPAAAFSGTAELFLLGPVARLLPEDFAIGPLADPRSASEDEKAALATAAALLHSVAAGAPDPAQLTADSREPVLDLLAPTSAGEEALQFRLGRPARLPDGELAANLRLLRGAGSAEGEVYLRREGGRWLVSDVQVNPATLAAVRARPAGRFFPSPYRWLLGGASPGTAE